MNEKQEKVDLGIKLRRINNVEDKMNNREKKEKTREY